MPINVIQSPIYESFVMLHPDGTMMCHCNQKKANWYVNKGLADWIDEKTFQLKFEPNGYGKSNSLYYTQSMENKCVVCGSEEQLNKHHVVPYVFRKRFPVEYKESNHHDIVATCVDCHENYENYANQYKKQLAEECGVSFHENQHGKENSINRRILSARELIKKVEAGCAVNDMGKPIIIPEERLVELKKIANQPINEAVANTSGPIWADKIVEKVLKEDKLFDFVKSWREHFLQYAKPRNMPKYWSTDYPLEVSNSALQNKLR